MATNQLDAVKKFLSFIALPWIEIFKKSKYIYLLDLDNTLIFNLY